MGVGRGFGIVGIILILLEVGFRRDSLVKMPVLEDCTSNGLHPTFVCYLQGKLPSRICMSTSPY